MSIIKSHFGIMPSGESVNAYKLTNACGNHVTVLSLGGIISEIVVPDKNGEKKDIACGFDSVAGYLSGGGYFGALIGRYANRIGKGKFTLNGVEYQLAKNDGENHLHGGNVGYNARLWDVVAVPGYNGEPDKLILTLRSPDGEENYPGNVDITVTYTFGDDNALCIHYEAFPDADTIINLTNHSYFNPDGYDAGDVREDELMICADLTTPVDDGLIPTGEIKDVEGTEFDFRKMRKIGMALDNNFCLDMSRGDAPAAELYSPVSGRTVTVYTDLPGIQIYDGVMMDGPVNFKGGVPQRLFHAIAMETQTWPDSINHDNFPSPIVRKGEKYETTTVYKFGVRA